MSTTSATPSPPGVGTSSDAITTAEYASTMTAQLIVDSSSPCIRQATPSTKHAVSCDTIIATVRRPQQ